MVDIDSIKIKEQLDFDCEVELLETVDSTNLYLKRKNNTNKNTLVIAQKQTSGKGRCGKTFYSDENGIYMSFLLNMTIPCSKVYLLTITAAVAVAEVLNELYGINAKIKWVNDIYCINKKICGILCEGVLNNAGCYEKSIIGIGINIFTSPFPTDISDIAIALEDIIEKKAINRNLIIASVINKFYGLISNTDKRDIIELYKSLSLMFDKTVTVLSANGCYTAKVIDIDSSAQLIVKKENGKIISLNSGEISIKL